MYQFVLLIEPSELHRRETHFRRFLKTLPELQKNKKYIVKCISCKRLLDKRHSLYFSIPNSKKVDYTCPVCV